MPKQKGASSSTSAVAEETQRKRTQFSQAEMPAFPLREALKVATALHENFAGGPEAPHNVAIALSMSPSSSQWRMLAGAALAYGLTSGSFSAEQIALSPLGRRILAPTEDGDDRKAILEASLKPRILNAFYRKFDRNKFPKDTIAKNILIELGVPKDRIDIYFEIMTSNGREAGILRETRTGPFVAIESTVRQQLDARSEMTTDAEDVLGSSALIQLPDALSDLIRDQPPRPHLSAYPWDEPVTKVFLSHGKNKKVLEQVKEIVSYGKFEPIVAAERETVSKPVPDKVMDDMRSCQAAVIHVASEGTLIGENGAIQPKINENVLIEIGAAMALYRRRFILLVEAGLQLPSNLQGLYEVRHEGDSLDAASTMKLLKAFNDFARS